MGLFVRPKTARNLNPSSKKVRENRNSFSFAKICHLESVTIACYALRF